MLQLKHPPLVAKRLLDDHRVRDRDECYRLLLPGLAKKDQPHVCQQRENLHPDRCEHALLLHQQPSLELRPLKGRLPSAPVELSVRELAQLSRLVAFESDLEVRAALNARVQPQDRLQMLHQLLPLERLEEVIFARLRQHYAAQRGVFVRAVNGLHLVRGELARCLEILVKEVEVALREQHDPFAL